MAAAMITYGCSLSDPRLQARAWAEFCDEHDARFEWIEPPPAAGKAAAGRNVGPEAAGGCGDSRAVVVTSIR